MLQSLSPLTGPGPTSERVATSSGFSLHAGVSCEAHQREKRERLCRYISRPPVAVKRLSLSRHGKVVYTLKTPWRDGTTQIVLEPLDFVARLAALVPRPRLNLTRYHGILAPHHRWRAAITPARRGTGASRSSQTDDKTPAERHAAMTWAQRLKRVFDIDLSTCARCGAAVRVIACIEEQEVIDKILAYLREKEAKRPAPPILIPPPRAPPLTPASPPTDVAPT